MSEELSGKSDAFFQGHIKGEREGYMKALGDMRISIHKVPTQYDSITVKLLDKIIDELMGK